MTTFTISIPPQGLLVKQVGENPDTVTEVRYSLSVTDGVHTESILQVIALPPTGDAPFTPFAELTEAQVVAWVEATVPAEKLEAAKEMLLRRLERKANPPVVAVPKAAPWQTCAQA